MGALPGVRERLRDLWGDVEIFDHHGMTKVGPVSFEDPDRPWSLAIIEEAYFAEIVDETGQEVPEGGEGELVLTTLERTASPLLRYRTGDRVRKRHFERGGRLYLEGGILGRTDDMAVIRGVNVYPTAVEAVVRQFPEVAEFMVEQRSVDAMEELMVLVELKGHKPWRPHGGAGCDRAASLGRANLETTFSLRIPVQLAGQGEARSRHEFKAQRWRKRIPPIRADPAKARLFLPGCIIPSFLSVSSLPKLHRRHAPPVTPPSQ